MTSTAKNTVISLDFLVRKFCGKAQFLHSFGRFTRNYAETVPFHKTSTLGNQVKLRYFSQWSANNFAFDDRPSARSFIYITNSSGPSMEPWWTLTLTSAQEEVCLLSTTRYFLFLKKLDNRFKILQDMPFFFSLKIITLCHTLSKALDMSKKYTTNIKTFIKLLIYFKRNW